jgi:hypothetical protein
MWFTNISENSRIYIYDESKTVSIDYYEREKTRENLLDTLKNYIIMDESIIQDIKYVG